jgi:hypothetical protein
MHRFRRHQTGAPGIVRFITDSMMFQHHEHEGVTLTVRLDFIKA